MMLVVLFAIVSAAAASLVVPIAPQINYIGGSALTHQSRVDVHSSPAVLAHSIVAPVVSAYSSGPAYGHLLKKRSLGYLTPIAPQINYIGGSALTHQSRVDVLSSPAVVAHSVVSPVVSAYSAWPAYGHGHLLKKRSLALAPSILAHAAPIAVAHAIPSAVSHQSRVDVHSSPAIVSQSVISPVLSHSVLSSPVVSAYSAWPAYGSIGHYLKKRSLGYLAVAPQINYIGGSALTHESRVDVRSSPAVLSQSVIAPVVSAYSAWPAYGHGHLLKKRSLALGYGIPAVSHQARVDVISSHAAPILAHAAPIAVAHAAPIAVAHAIPAAVSHQARVDVISPLAHSSIWSAPHGLYNNLALSQW